jgi:hypothetical protein
MSGTLSVWCHLLARFMGPVARRRAGVVTEAHLKESTSAKARIDESVEFLLHCVEDARAGVLTVSREQRAEADSSQEYQPPNFVVLPGGRTGVSWCTLPCLGIVGNLCTSVMDCPHTLYRDTEAKNGGPVAPQPVCDAHGTMVAHWIQWWHIGGDSVKKRQEP